MLGGATTFVTMACIIVVNPAILSFARDPVGAEHGRHDPRRGLRTYNIGNGLTAGLVLYPVLKVTTGRSRELNAGSVVLGLVCGL